MTDDDFWNDMKWPITVEGVDYVVCQECGVRRKTITGNHLKRHNMTTAEYWKKYPSADFWCKKSHDKLYGKKRNNITPDGRPDFARLLKRWWKRWKNKYRKIVLNRDNHKSAISPQNDRDIIVHHIIPWKYFKFEDDHHYNHKDNLISVNINEHNNIHNDVSCLIHLDQLWDYIKVPKQRRDFLISKIKNKKMRELCQHMRNLGPIKFWDINIL